MEGPGQTVRQWLAEGLFHQRQGNYSSALLAYRRVVSRQPDILDAWSNMGAVLRELGRQEEATLACEQALTLDPGNAAALCNLGCLRGDAGDFSGALTYFEQVLAKEPDHFVAQFQLGWALFNLGRIEDALKADDRAVALNPESAAVHLNRGYTLMKLARLPEAETAFRKSLALDPGLPIAHWNLAFLRLLEGRYGEAWPDYGWRWKLRDTLVSQRTFEQPTWRGESLLGQRVLVWAEQGFGDTLQFIRYLPLLQQRGGRVLLQVQPALVSLLQGCPGSERVLSEGEPLPPFDLQVPILDLPMVFSSTLSDLPCDVPYVSPPTPPAYQPSAAMVEALRTDEARTRVALVWQGNPNQKDNRTRSLDPALFEPLAQLPNVTWFNLQKYAPGVEAKPLPPAFKACDLGPLLTTFADTAYALEHMDLTISVDTAVAHLAGALGRPALVLLSFSPDWRWLIKGDSCPWYPTFRLYRQPAPGAWEAVIQNVLRDLA